MKFTKKSLGVLFIFVVFLVVVAVILFLLRDTDETESPILTQHSNYDTHLLPENPLNSVSPGITTEEDLIKSVGEPVNQVFGKDEKTLMYDSDFKGYPDEAVIAQGKVDLVKQQITFDDDNPLSIADLLPNPKSSATVKYTPDFGDVMGVFIYPLDGVAFVAHVSDETVFEVWRFTPATLEEVLRTWGRDLVDISQIESEF